MSQPSTSLKGAREDTIDALCRHFAEDSLTLPELERRLDKARAARTRSELDTLLADLRSRPPAPAAQDATRTKVEPPPRERPPARESKPPAQAIRPSKHLAVALMGGTRRVGKWQPADSMLAIALMGGVELDFRDAVFTDNVVDITCLTMWGGVEIIVPPDVRVETHGVAIMGSFEQDSDVEPRLPEDAPTIRVNGLAIIGSVEVKVHPRGEKLKRSW